jgi:serine/threonine protein kinase
MPPAPRARAWAPVSAPTASQSAPEGSSEGETATNPASRSRLGRSDQTADSERAFVSFSENMGQPSCSKRSSAPLPERVGPYRVHGQLGAGGVGMVYEAEDEGLGRRVAVKVLLDASPANQARFRREARAMGRLNHPNVATIYDVGESDGQAYIAMELVRGRTLREWLRDGSGARAPLARLQSRLGVADVLAVLRQAGAGLMAAHEAGLVHRDFKPDNVLVGDDGRVRVVDFGLAKHHAELTEDRPFDREVLARELADGRITRTGSLMGTPAYMAPEQFRGQGDARSDQFGFCVVVYESLYGRLPFAGETAEELFEATSRGKLRPWPSHADVALGVRAVLRRGLSAKAEDRFASMTALLDALAQAVAHGDAEPKRRHRTTGMRSWRWKIVSAATGLLIAAISSMLQSASDEPPQTQLTPTADTIARSPHDRDDAHRDAKKLDDTVHARTAVVHSDRIRPRPAQS